MPLLMCPNCNASMNEVKRNDVAFDMCPTCRGVWLDRGELEKIIAAVQGEQTMAALAPFAGAQPQQQPPQNYQQRPPQQGYGERGEYGEHGERGERGEYVDQHGRRRKRGGFDMFDFFD